MLLPVPQSAVSSPLGDCRGTGQTGNPLPSWLLLPTGVPNASPWGWSHRGDVAPARLSPPPPPRETWGSSAGLHAAAEGWRRSLPDCAGARGRGDVGHGGPPSQERDGSRCPGWAGDAAGSQLTQLAGMSTGWFAGGAAGALLPVACRDHAGHGWEETGGCFARSCGCGEGYGASVPGRAAAQGLWAPQVRAIFTPSPAAPCQAAPCCTTGWGRFNDLPGPVLAPCLVLAEPQALRDRAQLEPSRFPAPAPQSVEEGAASSPVGSMGAKGGVGPGCGEAMLLCKSCSPAA